jgi:hypothetical protein
MPGDLPHRGRCGLGAVAGDHRKIQVKGRHEAVEVFEVTGLTA